jgi:multicomponent Na+:H+ antiporter subunit E
MNLFAINIALAFAWAALTADFTLPGLVVGFALGYAALWLASPLFHDPSGYFLRSFRVVRLAVFFLWELILSSIQVVWDVLTPQHKSHPRIVEVPLTVETEFGILLTTNLISLTPGTLSLDVTPDRRRLVVHAMFARDPEAVEAGLRRFDRMVKEAVE